MSSSLDRRNGLLVPSAARELYKEMDGCEHCTVFREFGYWKFPTPSHGDPRSRVWIVGTDPRRIEEALRAGRSPRYWMGASRANLRDPLEQQLGRPLEEVFYLTDVVKCQRASKTLSAEALRECPPRWIAEELRLLRPTAILSLGEETRSGLRACAGLMNELGAEVAYLPHPSPANGSHVKEQYSDGWYGYRRDLLTVIGGWSPLLG